jgi:hypothetical protein
MFRIVLKNNNVVAGVCIGTCVAPPWSLIGEWYKQIFLPCMCVCVCGGVCVGARVGAHLCLSVRGRVCVCVLVMGGKCI